MKQLPIMQVLPDLKRILTDRAAAILIAEPGAGKTTAVPPAFLEEPWLAGKTILMLEPRRLAARSAAAYMASCLGESVGQTVGYRMRMDTKVGRNTRIVVVTEGVLTRMFQSDPSLGDVGLVIFDEFHERSLHADLGLALALEAQSVLREDLRILVMSATLDGERVASLLGEAPVVRCPGRTYPVETVYVPDAAGGSTPRSPQPQLSAGRLLSSRGMCWSFCPASGRSAGRSRSWHQEACRRERCSGRSMANCRSRSRMRRWLLRWKANGRSYWQPPLPRRV